MKNTDGWFWLEIYVPLRVFTDQYHRSERSLVQNIWLFMLKNIPKISYFTKYIGQNRKIVFSQLLNFLIMPSVSLFELQL